MPTDEVLEQRVAAVEVAIAEIHRRLKGNEPEAAWVERFRGAFKDEPAFAEVIALGRVVRRENRPEGLGS
ncbi:hypothetical protein [Tautonia rosea]|uniref:hypothetical protein n=1 Tax=Tautonia rosea TaxID=2728037 RepID=UPI00147282C7|nr:hypothetical protein [Tautonia rosea]